MPSTMSASEELVIQTGLASDVALPIAGLGARSFAFIIDWHIRLILAVAWFFGVTLAIGASGMSMDDVFRGMARAGQAWVFFVFLPAMAIYFLYHPVLEVAMKGRTPGKRIAGVRIVSASGLSPSTGALLLRNVFRLIDALPVFYALGFMVALFHPRQLRIGDIAAGTVLVYDATAAGNVQKATSYFAAGDTAGAARLELVDDLLARWDTLSASHRTRLATRLLDVLGEAQPAASTTNVKEQETALREHLTRWRAGVRP